MKRTIDELFTKAQLEQLINNDRRRLERFEMDVDDMEPVVKLFTPAGRGTWLLVSLCEEDMDQAFGLGDLGFGTPEMGYVSIAEMLATTVRGIAAVERDRHWRANGTMAEYVAEAMRERRIVDQIPRRVDEAG